MARLIHLVSRHAHSFLMAGLAAGLLLPALAAAMARWLPVTVAARLTLTAPRIGHAAARDLRWGLGAVAVLQLGVPLIYSGILIGLPATSPALALIFATSAPAISGGTDMALLLARNAGRRILIVVLVAILPATAIGFARRAAFFSKPIRCR